VALEPGLEVLEKRVVDFDVAAVVAIAFPEGLGTLKRPKSNG
jgi:hypothetical protein